MVRFILNNQLVTTEKPTGSSLVDFIRLDMQLTGTKTGCREGDCGACTVLEGTLHKGVVSYRSIVSCLTPIENIQGKHIVTIEGLNMERLTPVQEAIAEYSATQCGFCTPGFVVSLTAHCLSEECSSPQSIIESVGGNICRCTGYRSIEKAAAAISGYLKGKKAGDGVPWLVENGFLPEYFETIPERLKELSGNTPVVFNPGLIIGGGTDIMVQRSEELSESDVGTFFNLEGLQGISENAGICSIGAATTMTDLGNSEVIAGKLPEIGKFLKLVASEPVRNTATIGGNIVNASPSGDLTIILLALNASIDLQSTGKVRSVPLRELYSGYKSLVMKEGEYIRTINFLLPDGFCYFNFEKVSRRTRLDIASVNSAIQVRIEKGIITDCFLSAGGVSPVPLFARKTSDYLTGKIISSKVILMANKILQEEIAPISDIRGSSVYKRILLRQLFFAHFMKFCPGVLRPDDIKMSPVD
jgi:xanthine dehydrogenase small subunit